MVTQRQIRRLADQIARQFAPLRIILFGSYAYGKPTRDSDVDLLVIVNKGPTLQQEFPDANAGHTISVQPITTALFSSTGGEGGAKFVSAVLLAIVGLVLIVWVE